MGIVLSLVLGALLAPVTDTVAADRQPARLYRLDIAPRDQFTRLRFKLDRGPAYTVDAIPGNRLRIRLADATSPDFKRLRSFSSRQVQGVAVRNLMGTVVADVVLKGAASLLRVLPLPEAGILVVDVGLAPAKGLPQVLPGREQILIGAGKLVKEFDPPLTADLPFVPTPPQSLEKLLPPEEIKVFAGGEAFLYSGQAAEAEAIFASFAKQEQPIAAIAAFRLGEARYTLNKYQQALDAFRQGEGKFPSYLQDHPTAAFAYADTLVRVGGSPPRKTFSRLISVFCDKPYASLMVARFADVLARHGQDAEAGLIYRTVIRLFPGSRGASHAAMQLADRDFFSQDSISYLGLLQTYRDIAEKSGDFMLQDEASFKEALLESLYGPTILAMAKITDYEKRFSSGIFVATAKSVKEQLLPKIYREFLAAGDNQGLVKLALENRSCLADCLADPRFLPNLMQAFAAAGQIKEEIGLLAYLMRQGQGKPQTPDMILRILDDADRLSDSRLSAEAAMMFLERFPKHAEAGRIRERLAAQRYLEGKMDSVIGELSYILKPKAKAVIPESNYYLGKALAAKGRAKDADRAFTAFIHARKESPVSPFLADAYYSLTLSREASGNRRGAIEACRDGLTIETKEKRDQFLYKLGELLMQDRRPQEARVQWEKLAKEGVDPEWRKMASQAVASLDLQRELSEVKPLVSK